MFVNCSPFYRFCNLLVLEVSCILLRAVQKEAHGIADTAETFVFSSSTPILYNKGSGLFYLFPVIWQVYNPVDLL